MARVAFATQFHARYQRNNKHTGRKNLRCFPACHPIRHLSTGFCGQPVKLCVRDSPAPPHELRCWAYFDTADAPLRYGPGDRMREASAIQLERTRQDPLLPWMRGNIYAGIVDFDCNDFEIAPPHGRPPPNDKDSAATILINSERMGWHYAWVSNKHSSEVPHVLRAIVFVAFDNGEMECVGTYSSPEFQIYCRRRLRKPTGATARQDGAAAHGELASTPSPTLTSYARVPLVEASLKRKSSSGSRTAMAAAPRTKVLRLDGDSAFAHRPDLRTAALPAPLEQPRLQESQSLQPLQPHRQVVVQHHLYAPENASGPHVVDRNLLHRPPPLPYDSTGALPQPQYHAVPASYNAPLQQHHRVHHQAHHQAHQPVVGGHMLLQGGHSPAANPALHEQQLLQHQQQHQQQQQQQYQSQQAYTHSQAYHPPPHDVSGGASPATALQPTRPSQSPYATKARHSTAVNDSSLPHVATKVRQDHKVRELALPRKGSSDSSQISPATLVKLMEFICFKQATGDLLRSPKRTSDEPEHRDSRFSGGFEDFSRNLLGGILLCLDFNDSDSEGEVSSSTTEASKAPPRERRKATLGADLANFLVEEQGFTSEISDFFQQNEMAAYDEVALQELFVRFMEIVRKHIQGFLKQRNISMESVLGQLDDESAGGRGRSGSTGTSSTSSGGGGKSINVGGSSSSGGELGQRKAQFPTVLQREDASQGFNAFKHAFFRRLFRETRPAVFANGAPPADPELDLTGTWLNSGHAEEAFQAAQRKLAERGYPVFVFKVVRIILWRVRITVSDDYFLIQGAQKLMHSGEFLIKLDNKPHPFELPHVVPLGLAPIPCMYRANKVHHDHELYVVFTVHGFFPRLHGVRFEVTRKFTPRENRQLMEVDSRFDLVRTSGERECVASFSQRYFKVCGETELTDLLDFSREALGLQL